MVMQQQAAPVLQWLNRHHKLHVPNDWLEACIEWVYSEHQGQNVSGQQLKDMVYEQWLISDLRDIGAVCLPTGVTNHSKTYLNGCYHLQLMSGRDVSSPLYGQLQKITGKHNENDAVSAAPPTQYQEVKSSRMLKLHLTDGQQEIQAMEYRPIPQLTLTPGCKLQVFGKVLCRKGVLFLTKECVKVLGGEVDALVEELTPDNVLSSALERNVGLSQNQPPPQVRKRDPNTKTSYKKPAALVSQQTPAYAQHKTTHNSLVEERKPTVVTSMDDTPAHEWNDDFDDDDMLLSQIDIPPPKPAPVVKCNNRPDCNSVPPQTTALEVPHRLTEPSHITKPEPVITSHGESSRNVPAYNDWQDFGDDEFEQTYSHEDRPLRDRIAGSIGGRGADDDEDEMFVAPQAKRRQLSTSPVNPTPNTHLSPTTSMHRNASIKQEPISSKTLSCLTPGAQGYGINPLTLQNPAVKQEPLSSRFGTSSHSCAPSQQRAVGHITPTVRGAPRVTAASSGTSDVATDTKCLPTEEHIKMGTLPLKHCNIDLTDDPFIYLRMISESWPPTQRRTVHVKAYISTLTTKLEHNGGKFWSLSVKINDGSHALDVDIADQMLTELIGFSSGECLKMKPLAKADMQIRQKMTQGIKQCQGKIISLSALLHIDLLPGSHRPLVTGYSPVSQEVLAQLKQRVLSTHHNAS